MIQSAEVTSVTPFRIKFAIDSAPSDREYPRLSSYSPVIGDKVAVLSDNGNVLVLGKVVV